MTEVEFKRMVSDSESKWIVMFKFGEIGTPVFMMTEYEFARKLKDLGYVKKKE